LPAASEPAPLLCDNTWQVAPPMTSNPKAVQNGQRSSPNSFHFGAEKSYAEVNAVKSLPKPERQQQDRHTAAQVLGG